MIVTVGAERLATAPEAGRAEVPGGSAIFNFIPDFSKIVVFGPGGRRSKFSSSDFCRIEELSDFEAKLSGCSLVGDPPELMFFSFIRLKIFTFRRPELVAVVTRKEKMKINFISVKLLSLQITIAMSNKLK